MKRNLQALLLVLLAVIGGPLLILNGASAADAPKSIRQTKLLRDKTLVAWVCVVDTDQQGGSVLTLIDKAEHFEVFPDRKGDEIHLALKREMKRT